MRKHWTRNLLLAVSAALLLGGGVALAGSLTFVFSPDCLLCYTGDGPTEDGQLVTGTTTGWQEGESVSFYFTYPDGYETPESLFVIMPAGGALDFLVSAGCDPSIEPVSTRGEVSIRREHGFGVHSMTLTGPTSGSITAELVIVDDLGDCASYRFVPEPGTVALLGSGLAGLAGYVGLRLRRKQ